MTDRESTLERNEATAARLETLISGSSGADLRRSLGGGWTVTVALTHLAFWDLRQREALAHFGVTGVLPEEDDAVNPALELIAKGMDPEAAGGLATEAAKAVNATVAALTPDAFATLAAGDNAYVLRRFAHREDHIAQIEAALA